MKNIYRSAAAAWVFCVAIVTIFASVDVNAQGRYSERYSRRDVSAIVAKVERSSTTFRRDFDRAMDRSNLNGTPSEDRFNSIVRNFENSVDRLRREYDQGDSWWESRNNVQSMLGDAQSVNNMMTTISFRRNIERQWNQLRTDVNTIADTYDLPGLNGGGWNGGPWNGGGWGGGNNNGNAPSWAVGTFYGRNPQTGGTITLSVNRNGQVTADFQGAQSYNGSLNGTTLNMGGATARVTRLNNGIRTRGTNGEVIDYYRNGGGGSGGGDTGSGNVPNWAVGTFYAQKPRGGGRITLTIRNDGQVYADFGGGVTAYGTLYGTTLTVNNATATVRRNGNGIRTTNTDNGEYIDYTR